MPTVPERRAETIVPIFLLTEMHQNVALLLAVVAISHAARPSRQ
jgi:hypothetical protein